MSFVISLGTAFWLGILTSISPCPLATNIAAISYLSKKIVHVREVLFSGIAYTIGRMLAYAVLGWIIINSLLSVPAIAQFLQRYMNRILGPVLIIIGLFLLDIFKLNISGLTISEEKGEALASSGVKGAFALGVLFALSFCPVSAALFFGSLIPLSLSNKFGFILPFVYGIATGLPVLFFAVFTALGIKAISRWFSKISRFEKYARKVTGIIFILTGLYYFVAHVLPWLTQGNSRI